MTIGATWRLRSAASALALAVACTSSGAARAADVFIDPSSGSCPGLGTQASPYCDWRNAGYMLGGNRYLQRAGTTYSRTIRVVRHADDSGRRSIYIGRYGTGDAPRVRIENPLQGADDTNAWRRVGGQIWAFDTTGFASGDPRVLLLDGRRAFGPARAQADLCARKGEQVVEWIHVEQTLFVCSPKGNPATVFAAISGMQIAPGQPDSGVRMVGQSNVVIDGLTIEGGANGAIVMGGGSSDIEIRNSTIGRDSPSAIMVNGEQAASRRIRIHHNTIDSGIRWGLAGYEPSVSGEGVYFYAGVEDSEIHDNTIVAWPHNGVYLNAVARGGVGVRRIAVVNNEFHCGPDSSYFDYCRPFGIDGLNAGSAEHNLVAGNRIHDFSVRSQVNGSDNVVAANLCYNTVNSRAKSFPTGQCFSLQPYQHSSGNLIINNTMYSIAAAAIEFVPGAGGVMSGHQVINNIMQNCGRQGRGKSRNACVVIMDDPSVGSQTILNNWFYNDTSDPRIAYRTEGTRNLHGFDRSWPDRIAGNMVADSGLKAPDQNDFALLVGSPARGAASAVDVKGLSLKARDVGAWQSEINDWRWPVSPKGETPK